MLKIRNIIAVTIILVMLFSLTGCTADSRETVVRVEPTYVSEASRVASPVPAAEAFDGGSGTEEDPYQIATAEQLALLAKYVNEGNEDYSKACYIQTADIVMNDTFDLENWDKRRRP